MVATIPIQWYPQPSNSESSTKIYGSIVQEYYFKYRSSIKITISYISYQGRGDNGIREHNFLKNMTKM